MPTYTQKHTNQNRTKENKNKDHIYYLTNAYSLTNWLIFPHMWLLIYFFLLAIVTKAVSVEHTLP